MIKINPNINFAKKNKFALIGSSILIVLSIISIITFGLNLGMDFTGGTRFDFESNNSLTEIKNSIDKTKIKDSYKIIEVEKINENSNYKNAFSLRSKIDFKEEDIKGIKYDKLLFGAMGKSVSDRLKYDAIWAMSLAIIIILI